MSLLDLYEALKGGHDFYKRVGGACMVADAAIVNEDTKTTNHENRVVWAKKSVKTRAMQMLPEVLQNPTIAADPGGCTDADIQFVVNSLINKFADGK